MSSEDVVCGPNRLSRNKALKQLHAIVFIKQMLLTKVKTNNAISIAENQASEVHISGSISAVIQCPVLTIHNAN